MRVSTMPPPAAPPAPPCISWFTILLGSITAFSRYGPPGTVGDRPQWVAEL
jgi:hypothetical protein